MSITNQFIVCWNSEEALIIDDKTLRVHIQLNYQSFLELSETFDLLDVDKDGRLSRGEIAALLRTVNVEPTRVELDFIFQEMDTERKIFVIAHQIAYLRGFAEMNRESQKIPKVGSGSFSSVKNMRITKGLSCTLDFWPSTWRGHPNYARQSLT